MRVWIPLLLLCGAAFGQPFEKAMVTEILLDGPFGVEITNRDHSAFDLSNHVLHVSWETGGAPGQTSFTFPMGTSLDEGDAIVVTGPGALSGTSAAPVLAGFATVPPATGAAIVVSLVSPAGVRVDDVLVSSDLVTPVPMAVVNAPVGATSGPSFFGFVARDASTVRLERIGGLDSDGGSDWTEEVRIAPYNIPHRFGNAKINSGARGTDPRPTPSVVLSEIHSQGSAVGNYCEIHNTGTSTVSLDNWFFMTSETHGSEHSTFELGTGISIAAGEYVVIGDTPVAPTEGFIATQAGGAPTQYIAMATDFPWDEEEEFDLSLYTAAGQLVDACECTHQGDSHFAHNFPRAPGHWADFHGHVRRGVNGGLTALGFEGVARVSTFVDTNTGHDWLPVIERSLGGPNFGFLSANTGAAYPFFESNVGLADAWDVQLFQPEGQDVLTMIVNAGAEYAGATMHIFVGADPENLAVHGGGPLAGLTGGSIGAPSLTGSLLFAGPLLTLDARGMGVLAETPMPVPVPELEAICVLFPQPGATSPAPLRTYVLGYPAEDHHE